MAQQKILFVNIAWMKEYKGPKGDKAEGNFGFMKENPNAIVHESWNFSPLRGKIYGYVPRSTQANIVRLGAKPSDEKIDGVTVVWVSRNPRVKMTVIVGWYENATVHKQGEHIRIKRAGDFKVGYQIEASQDDAILLPVDTRTYHIPTKGNGQLGQSPVWYGKNAAFNSDVLAYIKRGGKHAPTTIRPSRQPDPEKRRKVEQAAINHAIAHFKSANGGNRIVTSVEKDGAGWDLEAVGDDGEVLKIEVKGLSGKDLVVELTPNEFSKMQSIEHRKSYIVYVLLDALSPKPFPHIFRFDAIQSKRNDLYWVDDLGRRLKIEPIVAARLSCSVSE